MTEQQHSHLTNWDWRRDRAKLEQAAQQAHRRLQLTVVTMLGLTTCTAISAFYASDMSTKLTFGLITITAFIISSLLVERFHSDRETALLLLSEAPACRYKEIEAILFSIPPDVGTPFRRAIEEIVGDQLHLTNEQANIMLRMISNVATQHTNHPPLPQRKGIFIHPTEDVPDSELDPYSALSSSNRETT